MKMKPHEFQKLLEETIADGRLDREEAKRLRRYFEEAEPDGQAIAVMRSLVFKIARASIGDHDSDQILTWLEKTLKTINPPVGQQLPDVGVLFGPDERIRDKLIQLINRATWAIDVCVFNITDNKIARALIDAKRHRDVAVRIITDDEMMRTALGNDAQMLANSGVAVAVDSDEQHMHHKFAVFDQDKMVTGSFNWTNAGWSNNHENFLFTDDPRLIKPYLEEFEKMWAGFERVK